MTAGPPRLALASGTGLAEGAPGQTFVEVGEWGERMNYPRRSTGTGDPGRSEPQLAIVCGLERSGTSVLRRLLSTHPQAQITREFHTFVRVGAAWPRYLASLRWTWWTRDYVGLAVRPRWRRAAWSASFALGYALNIAWRCQGRVGLECIRSRLRTAFPQAEVVGDKDPEYVFQLDALAARPELKCIVIFRDCRDVVSSTLAKATTAWKRSRFVTAMNTPTKVAIRWVQAIAQQERSKHVIPRHSALGAQHLGLPRAVECPDRSHPAIGPRRRLFDRDRE